MNTILHCIYVLRLAPLHPFALMTQMPPAQINNRRDVLLLLLYSPGKTGIVNEPIAGRTRMVKMLFLFKSEALTVFKKGTAVSEENFYLFFPWNFGPFSLQVYDDIAFFQLRGFITATHASEESLPEAVAEWSEWLDQTGSDLEESQDPYEEESFTLTESGVNFTAALYEQLSDSQKTLLRTFKTRFAAAPLRSILRYVYERYPTYTTASKIKGKVLGDDSD